MIELSLSFTQLGTKVTRRKKEPLNYDYVKMQPINIIAFYYYELEVPVV